MLTMLEVLHFTVQGLLGAFAAALFWAKGWQDLKSFECLRHLIVGAILGYLYSILHSEYNWPNLIVAFIFGWMGKDAVEAIVERFKGKMAEKSGEG